MKEVPKAYVASEYEADLYRLWESEGVFTPHTDTSKPAFSIVMPPPNANGNLHMGHALTTTLQDIMVRYHRMKGDRTLYIPGADHAGFETQIVFEKKLEKEGRSRFQMERQQFYDEVMRFTQDNRQNMEDQLRMLGASCDWNTKKFTLDPEIVDRVYATFRRMFKDGLIYRGNRIVNYSVKYQTAYSDLEVVHEDRVDPLYYIKYGPFTVATVRPETKFGEKVIVVHPEDPRYKHLIGTTFKAKIVTGEELEMTVIGDEVIDPKFGTGAMTITPAHDPVDFELAQRHNIPIIPIIGKDGRMLPIAGEFAGMKVATARTAVAEKMQELGLIEKIDPNYNHSVGLCYKSMQPIEPMVMPQWYVNVGPLRDAALKAIKEKKVRFHPKGGEKILTQWLENLRDWNISRQIWWGIPIKNAFDGIKKEDLPEGAEAVMNDEDTFDTWFSSGQWPYLVLETQKGDRDYMKEFYPTSVMETGRDLIFFWVSRMLMLGLYEQGDVPFKDVYMHGMVLDKHGKKMSKSKGNVVSPVDLIAKYGADAVRFGLLVGSSAGSDIPLPEEKIVGGRNFANKLWNMSRFVVMQLPDDYESPSKAPKPVTDADKDILKQLASTRKDVTEHLEKYRFAQALQALHDFAWHQFADVYVEAAKGQNDDNTKAILSYVLTDIIRLAHPFMPFVTEAIWQKVLGRNGLLAAEPWQ